MKRNDIILGAAVFIIALVLLAFSKFQKVEGKQIEVSIAGEVYVIKELGSDEMIEITNDKNEIINVIVIEDGEAYMKEASCPDALCIKQGHIYMTKETIICLPNKVTVNVIGEADEQIDAIAR